MSLAASRWPCLWEYTLADLQTKNSGIPNPTQFFHFDIHLSEVSTPPPLPMKVACTPSEIQDAPLIPVQRSAYLASVLPPPPQSLHTAW